MLPGTDLTFSGVWWILVGRVVIGENGNYKATDALSGPSVVENPVNSDRGTDPLGFGHKTRETPRLGDFPVFHSLDRPRHTFVTRRC